LIYICWDITSDTRIDVLEPCSPYISILVEDGEIDIWNFGREENSSGDS